MTDLYPEDLRPEIDALDAWLDRWLGSADRADLREALRALDQSVADERYLLGDRLTRADVHLLASLDSLTEPLPDYPGLNTFARNLRRRIS